VRLQKGGKYEEGKKERIAQLNEICREEGAGGSTIKTGKGRNQSKNLKRRVTREKRGQKRKGKEQRKSV